MDTNFIFSCSTRYLTRSLRSLVRYRVEHSKIKFVSTRGHVISSVYHSSWTLPILDFINDAKLDYDTTKVWKRVRILGARSENGCGKWNILVWNWVRILGTGRHTPTKNSEEYPPGATSRRRVAWLMFLPCFDVLCALSEYRPTAKWNLFVLYNNQDSIWPQNFWASITLSEPSQKHSNKVVIL